jgi:hypothetical protein
MVSAIMSQATAGFHSPNLRPSVDIKEAEKEYVVTAS